MSESASNPRVVGSDLVPAEVPAKLWLRSGRPFWGTATRVYIPFALIVTAVIFLPRGPLFWGVVAAGIGVFMVFPLIVQGLLAPLERRILKADRREATALLQEVRQRQLVRQFAPHAWATLQEGRLHLRRGDGKAAARAFSETSRLSRGVDAPALVSMQAQALLISDQPDQARELLQAQAKRQTLSPTDRLHLGLAMLASKGHNREALELVEGAQHGVGNHPRALGALALALHRVDRSSEAMVALESARAALGDGADAFDEALVERASKLLRPIQKAQQKRVRKQDEAVVRPANVVNAVARVAVVPARDGAGVGAGGAAAAETKVKSARKAKKDERRAARRTAKAEKQAQPVGKTKGKAKANEGGAVKAVKAVVKATPAVEPVKVAAPQAAAARVAGPAVEAVKPTVAAVKVEAAKAVPVEVVKAVPVEVAKGDVVKPAPVEAVRPAPVEVKAAPVEVKAAPVEVKAAPVEVVKPVPVEVKPAPVEVVKPVPVEVKPAPVEVKPAPVEAKAVPVEVKAVPVEVKAVPVEVKAVPVEVKAAPVEVKAAPVEVKAAPVVPVAKAVPGDRSESAVPGDRSVAAPVRPQVSGPVKSEQVPLFRSEPVVKPAAPRMPPSPSQSALFGSVGAAAKPAAPVGPPPPPAQPRVPVLGVPPMLGGSVPPPPRLGPPPAVPPPPRIGALNVTAPVIASAAPATDDTWAAMLDALEDDRPAPPSSQ